MNKTQLSKRLLGVDELATYLGLSSRTIYNQIGRKATRPFPLRARRVGKLVKFDKIEVDGWIDAGCPKYDKWRKMRETHG